MRIESGGAMRRAMRGGDEGGDEACRRLLAGTNCTSGGTLILPSKHTNNRSIRAIAAVNGPLNVNGNRVRTVVQLVQSGLILDPLPVLIVLPDASSNRA